MKKQKCYFRIERILRDMKHHGFVDSDDQRYWFDRIMWLEPYVQMNDWDGYFREATKIEDDYHTSRLFGSIGVDLNKAA